MIKFVQKLSVLTLAASLLVGGASQAQAQDKEFEGQTVTVGIVSGPAEDVWNVIKDKAEQEEGIKIEFELFTDYNQPNVALQNGSIDLNAFQHVAFLEDWNEANDGDLTPLGYTFVSPMGAYSEKIQSLDELKEGDTIAIPNDPTNGGRAILALELAGKIKVDPSKGALVTPEDITENPLNLQIEELDAAQLAISLPDVAAAFINLNFATDAGLKLSDAVFVDADHPDQLNEKYKNVIASREEDKDNPLYHKIVELYQSQEGAQAIYDSTNGGDKPIWEDAPVITSASH
ncbi:MetQ/NlpA family ABC transporter substrate-binding protein [Hutsoniella sourekii]|uniref:MetQ/NlpA family ABC transporter substrate-binding protein n=1 Tax=Hutsoniella sourekii TaxID=87650 RepID=UPI00048772F0|nr:MetQ/NlpA family ABC transporter substrate-binding protein [Hutsoniella sourekii]